MEKFVFDVFMFAEKLAILEVARSHNFAPLKNAPDASKDNVNTCREALFSLHRQFAEAAGAKIVAGSDEKSLEFEIDSAISIAGEGLMVPCKWYVACTEGEGGHAVMQVNLHMHLKDSCLARRGQ